MTLLTCTLCVCSPVCEERGCPGTRVSITASYCSSLFFLALSQKLLFSFLLANLNPHSDACSSNCLERFHLPPVTDTRRRQVSSLTVTFSDNPARNQSLDYTQEQIWLNITNNVILSVTQISAFCCHIRSQKSCVIW